MSLWMLLLVPPLWPLLAVLVWVVIDAVGQVLDGWSRLDSRW
jgi:hypothetical protein